MKRYVLLFLCTLCAVLGFAQSVTIYATGASGSYTTGGADYTASLTAYNRTDNAIKVSNKPGNLKRGYAVFDLSGVPSWATVTGVVLGIDVSAYAAGTYGASKTYGIAGDLSLETNASALYDSCGGAAGTLLWNAATVSAPGSYGSGVANYVLVSSAAANAFVQSNVGNKVSVSFYSMGTNAYTITGETGPTVTSGTHAPYMLVYYTGIPSTCGIIMEDTVYAPTDTICDPTFYVKVSCDTPSLRLKTYYGDGTTDSIPFTAGVGVSSVYQNHTYALPGCYTVKHIVYNGSVAIDTNTFTYCHTSCCVVHLKFYPDNNLDCIWNSTEPYNVVPVSVRVDSAGVPVATLAATSGIYYHERGGPGTVYSFHLLPGNMHASCPSSGIIYDTVLPATVSSAAKNMGLICMSAFDIEIIPDVIGSGKHQQNVTVYARNNGCTSANASVVANFSPKYKYGSSNGSYHVANTITMNKTIPALEQELLTYQLNISPNLIPGDSVHSDFSITPVSGDVIPGNNSGESVDTVKSSYDPNNVTVLPVDCFDVDTVLHYAVHFENTGNDTAHNIYVMDTLSANVDMSSLKIIAASAEMDAYVFTAGSYNIIKFDFANIKLLDSSYHGLCDGSVLYTINTTPGLPVGTVITNRAGIYFDDNEVVMTNMTGNTKGCPEPEPNSVAVARTIKAELFPNPATNELTIKTEQDAYSTYAITNNVGQVLMQQPLNGVRTIVNVSTLPAGLYYVTLKGDNRSRTMKFVKM